MSEKAALRGSFSVFRQLARRKSGNDFGSIVE
jgi:hypothetical protein